METPNLNTTNLNIKGMMCDACAGHVTRALLGLPGVEKADVSLADSAATVTYDPARVSLEQMAEAVADEGYEAGV